jgi:hypothetical protein
MESGIVIEKACLTLFVIISFLNIGLMAIDANEQIEGTGVSILGGQQLSGQLNISDMDTHVADALKQSAPQQDLTTGCATRIGFDKTACEVTAYLTGAVNSAVAVPTYLIAGLGVLWSLGSFIVSNLLPGSAAYWQLLTQLAFLLEGNLPNGPIHLLFGGIALIIYIIYMFGVFYFAQIIASVVRG